VSVRDWAWGKRESGRAMRVTKYFIIFGGLRFSAKNKKKLPNISSYSLAFFWMVKIPCYITLFSVVLSSH
jgi:hypothetical protein